MNTQKETALIQIREVGKVFGNAAGAFTALNNINLDFYAGEFVGVVGKSGSGKSTLINMITGIDRPTRGKVLVNGVDLHAMSESARALWRGKTMGVVFQFFQLLPMLTLLENTMLPMDFCNTCPPAGRESRAMQLLQRVGLADQADKLPGAISGGQQQCAAIARALATDPPIIIADEPTGNLDVRAADLVYDIFTQLSDDGRTIIMITHDPEIEARLSRTVLISDGRVINPYVAAAFSSLPHADLLKISETMTQPTQALLADADAQHVYLVTAPVPVSCKRNQHALLQPGDLVAGSGWTTEKIKLVAPQQAAGALLRLDPAALQALLTPTPEIRQIIQQKINHQIKERQQP